MRLAGPTAHLGCHNKTIMTSAQTKISVQQVSRAHQPASMRFYARIKDSQIAVIRIHSFLMLHVTQLKDQARE